MRVTRYIAPTFTLGITEVEPKQAITPPKRSWGILSALFMKKSSNRVDRMQEAISLRKHTNEPFVAPSRLGRRRLRSEVSRSRLGHT